MQKSNYKVLYFINFAPNYRDVFLKELGKHIDLTVVSYAGKEANLKDPQERVGYKYICLKRKRFLKINFNTKEFTLANGDYDVVIVGYTLWNPFRMMNLFRKKKRVICEGKMYGESNVLITRCLRRLFVNSGEGVLVYSKFVKEKLLKETKKPIIVFNNTSYSKTDLKPLSISPIKNSVNIIWVGRYQKRKKLETLLHIARKHKNLEFRIIGPGIIENLKSKTSNLNNVKLFGEIYDSKLQEHFEWSHAIFNPGAIGLLVMNAARFQRPLFINPDPNNGAEIQLAKDSGQDFIEFSNDTEVRRLIDKIYNDPSYIKKKAYALHKEMHNYTVEYMAQQYLKAIRGEWN